MEKRERWDYKDSEMDTDLGSDWRQGEHFQAIVQTVEGAIKLLRSGTWGDLRKVVEQAGVTREKLAAAVESLSLIGLVGIEQRGSLERLHYIPTAQGEEIARVYGHNPTFYRAKRNRGVKAHF